MKKSIIVLPVLLFNLNLFGQNVSIDKIKQENQKLKELVIELQNEKSTLKQDTSFLRKEIALCSLYGQSNKTQVSNSNSNYKFSFLSCKGSRASQSVVVTFMIEHSLPNQTFNMVALFNNPKAFDSQGKIFSTYYGTFGGKNETSGLIPTDIPITGSLIFSNILPGNDLFKAVIIDYFSTNLDRSNDQKGTVEFKNLKIVWE
jgi:hypothetical protein